MFKVAVVLFPGTNCEAETQRSLLNAGLQPELVRWNQAALLPQYDAYVLPGGFAYEDRSRAGIIAALDPIMEQITAAATQGKPVIGICNGCQVLVESGLIPGLEHQALAGAVAMNTRVKGGQIIGTGFYHDTVYIKNVAPPGRCAMTMSLPTGSVIPATVANGEGRFIFPADLLLELEKHQQLVFKYCTSDGMILNEFPTTPNGAIWGVAGLCNKAGNVVVYMPHPERLERNGQSLFVSLRQYLEQPPLHEQYHLRWTPKPEVVEPYEASHQALQLFVRLIITDNAAKTVELALQHTGLAVQVTRQTHWEVWQSASEQQLSEFTTALVASGELLNTNKEVYSTTWSPAADTVSFLVRQSDDYEGKAIATTLRERFDLQLVQNIRKGVVWTLQIPAADANQRMQIASRILQTHILHNPYAQDCKLLTV